MDKDYLNRIEEILKQKRQANPLNQEANKLFNEMFPVKQFEDVFKLGMVYMLSNVKNDVSKYLCRDCNDYIDAIVEVNRSDKVMNKYFDLLIKK